MIFRNIRKRLKVFSILSSLIILIPVSADPLACASGPDDEELRYMLFNPDLSENKSWWTFFYNYKLNYLDGEVLSTADEQLLAQEWVDHLKLNAKTEDAYHALFGSLGDSALQQNKFFQEIQKNSIAREYFKLAKICETVCGSSDAWNFDSGKSTGQNLNDIKLQVLNSLEHEQDSFFKKKYAFQLLKVSFYNNDRKLFDQCYNTYFKGQESTVLDWWAMHYKSEVLDRSGKVDSANYLHARVFSNASAKMFISKQHFSRQNLDAVLALAANDEDRADILLLAEIINPGRSLNEIREIYKLNPDHKHLPLLISREINKLESWLASGYIVLQGYNEPNYTPDPLLPGTTYQKDLAYAVEFAEALGQMSGLKALQPEVYFLSAAYVNLLSGKTQEAEKYLTKVLETVLLSRKKDLHQQDVQDELGKKIQLLINARKDKFESQKMLFSLTSYLRYEFARKGMIAQAGLIDNLANNKFCDYCSGSSLEYEQIEYLDQNASAADVAEVLEMYHKRGKNSLEALLLKPYSNVNYLHDLQAVKYLREGKIEQAHETLKKIQDDFWYSFSNANQTLDRNPFIENDQLLTSPSMDIYNKREIVEKLITLEKEAKGTSEKQADNYFKLGNAWYNFTTNSWFMLRYRWSEYNSDHENSVEKIALNRARSYYKMALDVEQRPENKAKLLYMLVLINDHEHAKFYAREYEQMENTAFYKKRNCLTTIDLAQN
jgi:hypothetical protein